MISNFWNLGYQRKSLKMCALLWQRQNNCGSVLFLRKSMFVLFHTRSSTKKKDKIFNISSRLGILCRTLNDPTYLPNHTKDFNVQNEYRMKDFIMCLTTSLKWSLIYRSKTKYEDLEQFIHFLRKFSLSSKLSLNFCIILYFIVNFFACKRLIS